MFLCSWWNAYLQLLVVIYLWITISHLFACLPTLELTTFKQQVFSTIHWRQTATKKKQCNFDSGWLQQQQDGCVAFSIFMTRIWVLLRESNGMWPSTGLVSERINSRGPCLLEWFILFFRMRGCIVLTKMNALSLCLF